MAIYGVVVWLVRVVVGGEWCLDARKKVNGDRRPKAEDRQRGDIEYPPQGVLWRKRNIE